MIWAAMSSAGVGPLCFLKSTVNAAIYQEILEHFMLPSADNLYGDADFIFHSRIGTCTHCQRNQKLIQWPWCYCAWLASKLAWPEPNTESMGIVKRKMRDTRPNNADDLKAAIKATWASFTPEQCHRLIVSMPRRIDAVIHAKGARTKYWVHKWTYFSEAWHFCLKCPFLLILCNILIFWDTAFGVFIIFSP